MTKSELIKLVKNETGYSIDEVNDIFDSITTIIGNSLINGEKVSIYQFGSFKIKEIKPRYMRNIRTGEYQLTQTRHKIEFIPCVELKDAIW